MRPSIVLSLPLLLFFTIGRPIAGLVCLLLQLTLTGWLPAAVRAPGLDGTARIRRALATR